VEHHEVLTPGGKDGIYGITHFKNKAIAILPIDEEGNTWLVGQYRYALDAYSWEVPMGGGPLDVDTLASAQRELKEETGLSASQWTELQVIHTSNSVTDEVGYIFLAQGLTEGEPEFEDTEDISIKKLPFAEALDWVMQGKITDSLSVIAIFRVARALGY
jgi:8-oxo-dGTP pyrophosphatase MutT (NUDIX family)